MGLKCLRSFWALLTYWRVLGIQQDVSWLPYSTYLYNAKRTQQGNLLPASKTLGLKWGAPRISGSNVSVSRITDVGGEAMERQKWFEIIEHYTVSPIYLNILRKVILCCISEIRQRAKVMTMCNFSDASWTQANLHDLSCGCRRIWHPGNVSIYQIL